MDHRTTVRELDEMIVRTRSAAEREMKLVRALPPCGLRRRKERLVRSMRDHLRQLHSLQTTVQRHRRPGPQLR